MRSTFFDLFYQKFAKIFKKHWRHCKFRAKKGPKYFTPAEQNSWTPIPLSPIAKVDENYCKGGKIFTAQEIWRSLERLINCILLPLLCFDTKIYCQMASCYCKELANLPRFCYRYQRRSSRGGQGGRSPPSHIVFRRESTKEKFKN